MQKEKKILWILIAREVGGELGRVMLLETQRGELPGEDDQHFQMLQVRTLTCPLGFINKSSLLIRGTVFSVEW